MKTFGLQKVILLILFLVLISSCQENKTEKEYPEYPKLIATAEGIESIKSGIGKYHFIDNSINELKEFVDPELSLEKDFPTPKTLLEVIHMKSIKEII